jgi:hypothetical protein
MSVSETITRAEQQLRDIVAKRDKAAARAEQLAEQRKKLGFAVFGDGDGKARKQLDALNLEGATLAGEIQALEAAVVEANSRLADAKAAQSRVVDEGRAREVLELANQFDAQVKKLAAAGERRAADAAAN